MASMLCADERRRRTELQVGAVVPGLVAWLKVEPWLVAWLRVEPGLVAWLRVEPGWSGLVDKMSRGW